HGLLLQRAEGVVAPVAFDDALEAVEFVRGGLRRHGPDILLSSHHTRQAYTGLGWMSRVRDCRIFDPAIALAPQPHPFAVEVIGFECHFGACNRAGVINRADWCSNGESNPNRRRVTLQTVAVADEPGVGDVEPPEKFWGLFCDAGDDRVPIGVEAKAT